MILKKTNLIFLALISINVYANDKPPAGCHFVKEVCQDPGGTRQIDGIPVYEPCWNYQEQYSCPDWTKIKNSCDSITNCTENGTPTPVTPWQKQASYTCTTTTTTKKCTKHEDKKECSGSNDYANGNQSFTPVPTDNFSKAATYMSMLDEMGKSTGGLDPLQIFKGDPLNCTKPLHLGPFGNNCCDINVTERGSWYQNHCDANELKLGVARRKKNTHLVGTKCIQHMPWPLNHVCVKEEQAYCAFPSMMARIVQEQGRSQIDALAKSGSAAHNTLIKTYDFPFADTSSHWNKWKVNGVEVAAFSQQQLSQQNAVLWASYSSPLKVENSSEAQSGSIAISLNCKNGQCNTQLSSMGNIQNNPMDPTCVQTPLQSWEIAGSGVHQSQCVPKGSTPTGWDGLTWDKSGDPSFWIYQIQTATPLYLSNKNVNWTVNNKHVTGNGTCDTNGCQYQLTVDNNESGNVSFPYSCSGNTNQTNIDGITFGPQCNKPSVEFAVCTTASGCGSLPNNISDTMPDNGGWEFFSLPSSESAQKFLTRNVAVNGSCSGNNCTWQVTSLGENGYQDVVTSQASWQIFTAPVDNKKIAHPGYTPIIGEIYTTGGLEFRPYQYDSSNPPQDNKIKVMYRSSSVDAWATATLPNSITHDSPLTLGDAKIWGQCNVGVGVCNFNVAQSIKIIAMPWGSVDSPNCAGFTPAELQLIDFSKIDLSEYTNSLKKQEFSKQQEDNLSKQAQASAQSFKQNYQTGEPVDNPSPVSNQVVSVSPTSGVGGSQQNPFTVTLYSSSNFPQYYPYAVCGFPATNNNTNEITAISINWGDGSPVQNISSTKIIQAQGYEYANQVPCTYSAPEYVVTHTYNAPAAQKTTTMPITVELTTKNNGIQTTSVTVQNIWENGNQLTGIGQGGNASSSNHKKQANVMPGAGAYNPSDIPGIQKYN